VKKVEKKVKLEWIVFAQEYLASNDHIGAYMKAYKTDDRHNAATRGKTLLKHPAIQQLLREPIERKATLVNEIREEEIIKAAKDRVISEMEVDAVLCDIILGKQMVKKTFVLRGQLVKVDTEPDHSERIAAIDKYYRRFGSYAPEKHAIEPDPLEKMSDDDLIGLMETIKNTLE